MNDPPLQNQSPNEKIILEHEALTAQVLKIRAGKDSKESSSNWLRFFESAGFTAIITVVFGGLITQLIISSVQSTRTRNEQALTNYQQHLEQQKKLTESAFDLVGRIIYATQIHSNMTRKEHQGDENGRKEAREEVRKKFISTLEEWRKEEEKLGLLMSYYHYGKHHIHTEWRDSQMKIDDYIQCVNGIYDIYAVYSRDLTAEDYKNCQDKKEAVKNSMRKFAETLNKSRQYGWQKQLEIPSPDNEFKSSPSQPTNNNKNAVENRVTFSNSQ